MGKPRKPTSREQSADLPSMLNVSIHVHAAILRVTFQKMAALFLIQRLQATKAPELREHSITRDFRNNSSRKKMTI
jgi:hypothetical protein